MRITSLILPALFAAVSVIAQELQTCADLTVSSNNGDRKVVIVIDSSGSMSSADPGKLRLSAARALNEFLVSTAEAGGSKKPDQVAVVGFDTEAYTVFTPGDPGDPKAAAAISSIDITGGTYIAGGVIEAMGHIANMSGPTKDRSAIVVFTDGEDADTGELVEAINNATSQGIRVSFGYLDRFASAQPTAVLRALRDSKGVYATITVAAGSQNFINYVLLNGLTYQDNPQGAGDRLLAGLGTTQFISGPGAVTLKYTAEQGEHVNFTVQSFTGDSLSVEARMGGQTFQPQSTGRLSSLSSTRQFLNLTAPSNGQLDVLVSSSSNPKDGLFSVLTNSNQPIKNCTVGVSGDEPKSGFSAGAKAGVGIGVVAAVAALAGAAFYAYKHFYVGTGIENTTAGPPGISTTGAEGGANTTGFSGAEAAEKLQPYSHVTPIQPQPPTGAPTYPMAPTDGISSMPPTSGFDAPMHYDTPMHYDPPMHQDTPMHNTTGYDIPNTTGYDLPNTTGPGGSGLEGASPSDIPPQGALPSDIPPYGADPTSGPGVPGGGGGGGTPGAFIPPLIPPFMKPHSSSHNDSSRPGSRTTSPKLPQTPTSYNYNNISPGNNYPNQHPINHPPSSSNTTSSPGNTTSPGPGQVNTTGYNLPPSDPSSGGPYQHPNPTPGSSGSNQGGFPLPGPPTVWQAQQPKHHHHAWLAPDTACEHPECPLNLASGHQCSPSRETCVCTCRDSNCPVTRRGY
ncbi:von Willebrand factor type A domain-containing protein [Podospora australis]|uniref:von Willebrand factor type A domain-containing protein n=1 Tax=Podospora australis TaxID=1536484 RepID=A0AAN7ALP7_9PEZI|nr:von Willebrand factor type A domain-containing protein [Podospora australis]